MWLPVPSPVNNEVGLTEVNVGTARDTFDFWIFLIVPALVSKTNNTSSSSAVADNSVLPVIAVTSKCSSLIASSANLVALIASAAIFAVVIFESKTLAVVTALSCTFVVETALSLTVEICCTYFVPGIKTYI